MATADLYPLFTLGGTLALEALDVDDLFDSSSRAYGFGPAFRWNLFDGGRVRNTIRMQSAHFYSHGDMPLEVNGRIFNGQTHMPLTTKMLWFSGSNSILGNAKGHYDVVMNLLRHPEYRGVENDGKRMIEAVIVNEWWWTGSCEYADLVFAIDSWGEYNVHDVTQSCTNPFMQVMPLSKIERIHNTRSDSQIYAGVAGKLAADARR